MNAAFQRAAIVKPFKVLGRSLNEFSIGHEMLLAASGNAFAKLSERAPQFPDLLVAIRICTQDYSAAISDFLSGGFLHNRWVDLLQYLPFNPSVELLKFSAYLTHYRSGPEFTRARAGIERHTCGAPFEYVLKVFLCTKMRFTVEQALNYPYSTAVADYLTYLEAEGKIHIVDSVAEIEREALAMQDEIIAKGKALL